MGKRLLRAVRNIVIVGVIAAVVLFGVSQARQSRIESAAQTAQAQVLDETTAERGSLRVTISGTGAVLPERQVPLFFEAPGRVAEILVSEGTQVRAGDVIARLETTDLQAVVDEAMVALDLQRIAFDAITSPARDVDIAAAQAALDSAEAGVAAAYNPTASQQVEIARLQAEIARNRLWQAQLQRDLQVNAPTGLGIDISGLLPPDAEIPQEVIDQANAALNGLFPQQPGVTAEDFAAGVNQAEYGVSIADANYSAAANRDSDYASVAQANAAVVAAQTALDRLINGASELELQAAQIAVDQAQLAVQQAQNALDRAVLTAPFDGVVAEITLTVGETPPSQLPAAVLVDDTALYVDLAIDETDVVDVRVDQAVELRFDALPDTLVTGRVTEIAVAPTVIGQLVTYPVRVRIDPTEELIRIGMTSTATLLIEEVDDVLVLPNRFIRIDRDSQQAYVTIERAAGQFEEIAVELRLRSETQTEIISGLEEGQRVVLLPRAGFDITGGPP